MIIDRKEAVTLSSYLQMLHLDDEKYRHLLESAMAESGKSITKEGQQNKHLRKYIEVMFSRYCNDYLEIFLKRHFNKDFTVEGSAMVLYTCPCCGYNTLSRRSEYDICLVCFWEDDGDRDNTAYSAVNKMTLGEAKNNFSNFGSTSEQALKFLDKDRLIQFKK